MYEAKPRTYIGTGCSNESIVCVEVIMKEAKVLGMDKQPILYPVTTCHLIILSLVDLNF
jgi:hypothetical protein